MRFSSVEVPGGEPVRINISGLPGVGKSRLAMTFPHPVMLDFDGNGAYAAYLAKAPRLAFDNNKAGLVEFAEQIAKLNKGRQDLEQNGLWVNWMGKDYFIQTVVLDSWDVLQTAAKQIEIGPRGMTLQLWGKLADYMGPILRSFYTIPLCHKVIVLHSHVKQVADNAAVEYVPAVQGQMLDVLLAGANLAVEVIAGEGGRRYAVCQPFTNKRTLKTYNFVKDPHDYLKEMALQQSKGLHREFVEIIQDEDGLPRRDLANAVCFRSAAPVYLTDAPYVEPFAEVTPVAPEEPPTIEA
jgi:hypothetical protein